MNVPSSRPMQPREVTANLLNANGVRDAVCLVGERGYYLNSMGAKGVNDRDIYDDAIFLTSPSCHVAWNANVDPSPFRVGVASLEPGVWRFGLNIHGKSKPKHLQYECLEQVGPVIVRRDSKDGKGTLDKGVFAIQIHRGSYGSTSSLGCQTLPPDQWESFIPLVKEMLKRYGQQTLPYLLLNHQG